MTPKSIRLSEALDSRIKEAAGLTGLSDNDVIKLALDAGLRWLAKNDWDIHSGIFSQKDMEELLQSIREAVVRIRRDETDKSKKDRK